MKFLLEFVSCCGSSSRRMVEERKSLVPEERRRTGRKRGRLAAVRAVGGGGGSLSAEWKPTLTSISEDNVLPERNKMAVGSERVKRKKSSSTSKARPRHYREDAGRAQNSAMMPSLSPTPFLF